MLTLTGTTTADSSGKAELYWTCPPGEQWTINQAFVSSSSTIPSSCTMLVGNITSGALVSVTATSGGNNDTADGTPLVLDAGQSIVFKWEGAETGATCSASALYCRTIL